MFKINMVFQPSFKAFQAKDEDIHRVVVRQKIFLKLLVEIL